MATRKTTKPRENQNQKAIKDLIYYGVNSLISSNPRLSNHQDYFLRHVDVGGIQKKFIELYEINKQNGMSVAEARKNASIQTSEYIASGNLLDEKGKRLILREGNLERSLFEKLKNPFKKQEGADYLNKTTETFNELLNIMKEGKYKIPEIEKPLVKLHYLGFASPAIALLAEADLIDKKKEKYLIRNLYDSYKQNTEEVVKGIEKYVVPQKIAASVIGLIGTFLLIFNLKITGAVIGGDQTITKGIIGVFMIFFALLLYLRPLKKSFKK